MYRNKPNPNNRLFEEINRYCKSRLAYNIYVLIFFLYFFSVALFFFAVLSFYAPLRHSLRPQNFSVHRLCSFFNSFPSYINTFEAYENVLVVLSNISNGESYAFHNFKIVLKHVFGKSFLEFRDHLLVHELKNRFDFVEVRKNL